MEQAAARKHIIANAQIDHLIEIEARIIARNCGSWSDVIDRYHSAMMTSTELESGILGLRFIT